MLEHGRGGDSEPARAERRICPPKARKSRLSAGLRRG